MIPTPVDCMPDGGSMFMGSPGWWLFFHDADYTYPISYYVCDDATPKVPTVKLPGNVHITHVASYFEHLVGEPTYE